MTEQVSEVEKSIRFTLGKIRALTDANWHSEAWETAADLAGHFAARDAFKAIGKLKQIDGELMSDVAAVERRWQVLFKQWVETGEGGPLAKRAYEALAGKK